MATLSEAYKELPLNLKHIIPLDFKSVHGVPDSHVWTEINKDFVHSQHNLLQSYNKEELTSSSSSSSLSVPVIDFMSPNFEEELVGACERWGVFQIINHGIPTSVITEVEFQTRRLFELPNCTKNKVLRSPDGATGYGVARIQPFYPKFMWHEGFTIVGSPMAHATQLWPHDYQSFCDVMENYEKKMKDLAHQMFVTILRSLNISEEEDLSWKSSMAEGALQLNSFPICPDPKLAIGLADHTDSMLLTILHQSSTKGLEIFREGLGWITVPPISGCLVVNVGDLLHICTNGRFPSVRHRVLVNQDRHRYSVAFFYFPPTESLIAPFDHKSPPIYRSVTVKEFLFLKAKHLVNALSCIRIS